MTNLYRGTLMFILSCLYLNWYHTIVKYTSKQCFHHDYSWFLCTWGYVELYNKNKLQINICIYIYIYMTLTHMHEHMYQINIII
jgi:hypothetical protein